MDKDQTTYQFKLIIIGNPSAGKSCILYNFLENKFKLNSTHTIGVEYGSKTIHLDNKIIKLQIWDTAGQERFRSVARSYYKGAMGALVIYDLTSPESFHSINQWIRDARDLARPDISITVVGNKSDLKDKRLVSKEEGEKFCSQSNVTFLETSALTGDNVVESFYSVAKAVLAKVEAGQIDKAEVMPKSIAPLITRPRPPREESKCNC